MTAKFAGAPFDPEADAVIPLAEGESEYVYHDPRIVYAVNVAMIARRPLLVTGSPGSGKSTLADDVARRLGWALAKTTITSRTRLDDLVARFDAVKRLSHAQAKKIDERDGAYLVPGVFWWAFAPDSARAAISAPKDRRINPDGDRLGTVVLLDEIDKAEPDLPNDLLAPLDRYTIEVPGLDPISAQTECLVIITSNGERTMPPAFLRRCVTLELDDDHPDFFVAVAESHFGPRPGTLYRDLAVRTLELVSDAEQAQRRAPSMAEYLDALRACLKFGEYPGSPLWERIEEVALRKTPETRKQPPTASDPP